MSNINAIPTDPAGQSRRQDGIGIA